MTSTYNWRCHYVVPCDQMILPPWCLSLLHQAFVFLYNSWCFIMWDHVIPTWYTSSICHSHSTNLIVSHCGYQSSTPKYKAHTYINYSQAQKQVHIPGTMSICSWWWGIIIIISEVIACIFILIIAHQNRL